MIKGSVFLSYGVFFRLLYVLSYSLYIMLWCYWCYYYCLCATLVCKIYVLLFGISVLVLCDSLYKGF